MSVGGGGGKSPRGKARPAQHPLSRDFWSFAIAAVGILVSLISVFQATELARDARELLVQRRFEEAVPTAPTTVPTASPTTEPLPTDRPPSTPTDTDPTTSRPTATSEPAPTGSTTTSPIDIRVDSGQPPVIVVVEAEDPPAPEGASIPAIIGATSGGIVAIMGSYAILRHSRRPVGEPPPTLIEPPSV